jgi:hypothetical protein
MLYAVTYDGHKELWGCEIYLLGIYDSKEKAENAIKKCRHYCEIKEILLNKDVNEYIYGYYE